MAKFTLYVEPGLEEKFGREIDKAIFAGAKLVEIEATTSITAGSVSGKGHVPSKPGTPPNADTRVLDGSAATEMEGNHTAVISFSAPYAAAQEYGHTYGARSSLHPQKLGKRGIPAKTEFGTRVLPARPFLRPALAKRTADVIGLMQKALRAAAKGTLSGGSSKGAK